jgi:hypothetical protein
MSRHQAAVNAVPRTVIDYGTDPAGHALFWSLISGAGTVLNRQRAVMAAPQSFGVFQSPQVMKGAASAVSQGRARVIAPRVSELSQSTTRTTDASTSAIFRDRMIRDAR